MNTLTVIFNMLSLLDVNSNLRRVISLCFMVLDRLSDSILLHNNWLFHGIILC